MKNYLMIALFLIVHQGLYSQTKIELGKPYEVIDAVDKNYFSRGNEMLTLKITKKDEYIVQKFDLTTLKQTSIRVYDDIPKGAVLEQVQEFGERYFIFYSLWDKGKGSEQLFYREIDFESGTIQKDAVRVISTDHKIAGFMAATSMFGWGMEVVDKFDFQNAGNHLLIQYRLKPEKRNDAKSNDIIGMHVFDESMSKVWGREVEMPYTEKKMNNLDYSIDKEGNVYILTTVYKDDTTDRVSKDKRSANFDIELFKMTPKSENIEISKVDLGDKLVNRIWIFHGNGDEMVCAGFYSDLKSKSFSDVQGIITFTLEKNGRISNRAVHDIPLEVLNMYEKRRTQKKNAKDAEDGEAGLAKLQLDKLVLEDDGIVLIGEQQYSVTVRTKNGTYTTYYCEDMLMAKIATNGDLLWINKLPKNQRGKAMWGGMSYTHINNKQGQHCLLYLDNIKNLEMDKDDTPALHLDGAGGFLMAYIIDDKTGAVSKEMIFDTREVKDMEVFQFQPTRIEQIGTNQFVVEVYKKKKEDILIKVEL